MWQATMDWANSEFVYMIKMLTKNIVFYTVAGTVIALIAQFAGASLTVILLSSLLGPPLLLLIIRIIRY